LPEVPKHNLSRKEKAELNSVIPRHLGKVNQCLRAHLPSAQAISAAAALSASSFSVSSSSRIEETDNKAVARLDTTMGLQLDTTTGKAEEASAPLPFRCTNVQAAHANQCANIFMPECVNGLQHQGTYYFLTRSH